MDFNSIKHTENNQFFDLFSRLDLCIVDAKENTLVDISTKEYTDFLSGIAVCCLGYSDNGFKSVLKDQIDHIIHTSNYFYIKSQSELLHNLCKATGYDRAFFTSSGAEAVEGAIKLARKYFYDQGESKNEIITFIGSFHGRTLATLAATGQPKYHQPFFPLIESFKHVDYNDIKALEEAINEKTCAVLIEPVIGEGGVIPCDRKYYQKVRTLCDKNGLLMIADEIQTGVGRSGKFLASQTYKVKPDIVILAKSLGNGLPIGAFMSTQKVAEAFSKGDHGSTFGGNHLASAGANYVVKKMLETDLMQQVKDKGQYFYNQLKTLETYDCVHQVRGFGLMLGVQFESGFEASFFQKELLKSGFVAATAGCNTLRFLPPYTIKQDEIDSLCKTLNTIIEKQ